MNNRHRFAVCSLLILSAAFSLQSCADGSYSDSQTHGLSEEGGVVIDLDEITSPCDFCLETQVCHDDVCYDQEKRCGAAFCMDSEVCVDDACVASNEPVVAEPDLEYCDSERACPDGLTCVEGECWAICGNDICDAGEACIDDVCIGSCGNDYCSNAQTCINDTCVANDIICNYGNVICEEDEICDYYSQECVESRRYCKNIGVYCGEGNVCYEPEQTCVVEEQLCENGVLCKWGQICTNNECAFPPKEGVKIRIMAANTTSGSKQSYDPGHGARIFRGLKPDIVLIQEFNYLKGTLRDFVDANFGEDFHYCVGKGQIPNGIISRFPIKEINGTNCNAWASNVVSNRDWDWAVIDLPGEKDLLAVSVHLHTSNNASEMPLLANQIRKKMEKGDYYVALGGDFNTSNRKAAQSNFASMLDARKPYPVDQKGKEGTNAKRTKPYDWVIVSHDFAKYSVPIELGSHVYENGLVFDSRVFTPLAEVAPVQKADSGASNMQHMAVVRDFFFTGDN